MKHIPHVLIRGPWANGRIEVPDATRHHLETVMRTTGPAEISYTDGAGVMGSGLYAQGVVERDAETAAPDRPAIAIAVAPPAKSDRVRTLVEKVTELGVAEILWLDARYRQGRAPKPEKVEAWVTAAVQQSRAAWCPEVGGSVDWDTLATMPGVIVCDRDAPKLAATLTAPITLVIGPEGGFADDEVPGALLQCSLASTVLRTETAAIAAVAVATDRLGPI